MGMHRVTNLGPKDVCNLMLQTENTEQAYSMWPENVPLVFNSWDNILKQGDNFEMNMVLPVGVETTMTTVEGFYSCEAESNVSSFPNEKEEDANIGEEQVEESIIEEEEEDAPSAAKKNEIMKEAPKTAIDLGTRKLAEEEIEEVTEEEEVNEEEEVTEEEVTEVTEEEEVVEEVDEESEKKAIKVERQATSPDCEVFTEGEAELTLCMVQGGKRDKWTNEGLETRNGEQTVMNHRATLTNTGKVAVCNAKVDIENRDKAFESWPEFMSLEDGSFTGNGLEGLLYVGTEIDIGLTLVTDYDTSMTVLKGFHECTEGQQFMVQNNGQCDVYTQGQATIEVCNRETITDDAGAISYKASVTNVGPTVCNFKISAENAEKAYTAWPEAFVNEWTEAFGAGETVEVGAVFPAGIESQLVVEEGFYSCDAIIEKEETTTVVEAEKPIVVEPETRAKAIGSKDPSARRLRA